MVCKFHRSPHGTMAVVVAAVAGAGTVAASGAGAWIGGTACVWPLWRTGTTQVDSTDGYHVPKLLVSLPFFLSLSLSLSHSVSFSRAELSVNQPTCERNPARLRRGVDVWKTRTRLR